MFAPIHSNVEKAQDRKGHKSERKMEVEVSEKGTDDRNMVQSRTHRKTSKPPANRWT